MCLKMFRFEQKLIVRNNNENVNIHVQGETPVVMAKVLDSESAIS